jgi:hypothetical protein
MLVVLVSPKLPPLPVWFRGLLTATAVNVAFTDHGKSGDPVFWVAEPVNASQRTCWGHRPPVIRSFLGG